VTVIVFFAGSVLLWADRSNFSVAAAAWAKDLNWAPSTIGLMLSAFSLGYLVIQPIGGWIADQIGPRRTLAGRMAGLVALGRRPKCRSGSARTLPAKNTITVTGQLIGWTEARCIPVAAVGVLAGIAFSPDRLVQRHLSLAPLFVVFRMIRLTPLPSPAK
jgi:MFS family permease